MKKYRILKNILIPLTTAALAFAGALIGTYLSSKFEQSNWEARFDLEQKKSILHKRVELMDKTASLFGRTPIFDGLSANIDHSIELLQIKKDCLESRSSPDECEIKIDTSIVERSAKERSVMHAELSSIFLLASIYFGPDTKKSMQAISANPWKASDSQRQILIDAMGRELHYFPSNP